MMLDGGASIVSGWRWIAGVVNKYYLSYKKLSQEFTPKELAEAFIFPVKLSPSIKE